MAAKGGGEGFGGCEKGGDAGTHLAEGVEDAVEDDEEGKNGLLWVGGLVIGGMKDVHFSSLCVGFGEYV